MILRMTFGILTAGILTFGILMFLSHSVGANVNIVATIRPIHSIVSALTHSLNPPILLFNTAQLPHHAHLKPSQLKHISRADLIVSIHPNFESSLHKILSTVAPNKQLIIANLDGIILHHSAKKPHYHLWLNIQNMQIFARALTQKLIQLDTENSAIYQQNNARLQTQLSQLSNLIKQNLSAYQTTKMATFSNALHYFIAENQLQNRLTVSKFHGEKLSIYRILRAKKILKNQRIHCLLGAQEMTQKHLYLLSENIKINSARIDLLGQNIPSGARHYSQLMQRISARVAQCLK